MKINFQKADEYHKYIKKKLKFDQSGKWDGNHIFELHDIEELIYLELFPDNIDNQLQRQIFAREYRKQLLAGTFSGFKLVRNKVIKKYKISKRSATTKSYKLLIVMYMSSPSKSEFIFKTLKINEVSFRYLGNKNTSKLFCTKEMVQNLKSQFDLNKRASFSIFSLRYLLASTEAIDSEQAFDKITRNFNLIRAVYNYVESSNITTIRCSYQEEPIATLREPIAYLMLEDDKNLDVYYSLKDSIDNFYKSKSTFRSKISQGNFLRIKRILQKNQKTEVEKILTSCIFQLGNAFDEDNMHNRFLSFYRVCEYATGINIQRKNSDIVDLVGWYYMKIDKNKKSQREEIIYKAKFNYVKKIRNRLVHEGYFYNYSDIHVNWVKELAEASIQILIWMINNGIKTESEMKIFWELYPDFINDNLVNRKARHEKESEIIKLLLK